jgi:hypothetical protein
MTTPAKTLTNNRDRGIAGVDIFKMAAAGKPSSTGTCCRRLAIPRMPPTQTEFSEIEVYILAETP